MKCKLVAVGSEIMNGTTLDTNSHYIIKRLYQVGVEVEKGITISDERATMYREIKAIVEDSDLIYILGGLGPTEDDHTKEVVGEVLGLDLQEDSYTLKKLEKMYRNRGVVMPTNNRQQALKLETSILLENNFGTAPGLYIEKDKKKIFLLPGPPRELKPMFEDSLKYLNIEGDRKLIYNLNLIGIGESNVELILKDSKIPDTIEVFTYAKERYLDIQIKYSDIYRQDFENSLKKLELIFRENIYGHNLASLEEIFLKNCSRKGLRVSFAESCTGGLLSSKLTDLDGASKVFSKGLVTYSNQEKIAELGVAKETLDRYGAISGETAMEMAEGVRLKAGSDMGISTTGIVGSQKEEGKNPGLVYIGISTKDSLYYKRFEFGGSRIDKKQEVASNAFLLGIKEIEK